MGVYLRVNLRAASFDPAVPGTVHEMQGFIATLANDFIHILVFTQTFDTAVRVHAMPEVHILRS